jgi:hypothetical protein
MAEFGRIEFGAGEFGGTSSAGTACVFIGLLALVQETIDESGAGVFWPVQTVCDAINDAILEVLPIAFFPQTNTTITFIQGDDIVAWPNTTITWPQYLEYAGQTYFPTSHAQLERYDRWWRNAGQSQPRFFVLWDEAHLRIWPSPDKTYVFNIWGPAWPTEITTSVNDITTLPDLLRQALAFRACTRLFQYTRPDLAEAFMKEAEEHEALWRKTWRRFQSHNIKRLRPGTGFTAAQSGSVRIGRRMDGNSINPYNGP